MRALRQRRGPLPRVRRRRPRTVNELKRLGRNLGHYVSVVDSYAECDDSGGSLECECGWRAGPMKSPWLAKRVEEHLDDVLRAQP